jgi:hypothetical protein
MVHASLEGPGERQESAAGKNRIEFEYRPTLFRMLMILNRITIVLLLGFLIFRLYRDRLSRTSSAMPS